MRDRLPVYIDDNELPLDNYNNISSNNKDNSYGYVSVLYLISLIITIISLLVVIVMWNR